MLCKNDIFPPRVLFYLNRIKFLKNEPVIEILYWSITAPLICSGTVRTVLSEPIPSQDFQSHYACTFRWSAFNSETVSQHYLRIIQLTTAAADCTILFADYIGTSTFSTRLTALATLHWIIFMTRSFLFGAFQTLGTVFLKCKVTDQMKNTLLVQLEG